MVQLSVLAVAVVSMTGFSAGQQPVPRTSPAIEQYCENTDCSRLMTIWKVAIENQGTFGNGTELLDAPRTIVTPSDVNLINYTPQDVPSPFFSDFLEDRNLTARVVRDFFASEFVDLDDEKLKREGGYTLKNLNGKDLIIRKSKFGELSVNDFPVIRTIEVGDACNILIIDGALFDHMKAMFRAMEILLDKRPFNPWAIPPKAH